MDAQTGSKAWTYCLATLLAATMLLLAPAAHSAPVVTNPSFETDSFTGGASLDCR